MVPAHGFRPSRRATTGLLAGALLAGGAAWRDAPLPLAKGVTFTFSMTLRPPAVAGRQPRPTVILGTGRFANGRGRIDFDSTSGTGSFARGDYFVVDSGRTFLVRPSVQTYAEVESPILSPFRNLAAQVSAGSISAMKVEMEKVGGVDTVVGLPAQRYRIVAEHGIDLGGTQANSHTTTELWIAKLPFRFVNPVEANLRAPRLPRLFQPVLDRITEYSTQLAREGATVKSITTTSVITAGGTTYDVEQTFEILSVKEAEVDEGSFRIPDRFRRSGGSGVR